jgi:aspartate-alanine antiporter
MSWIEQVAKDAPEIFILLAVAIGTLLGRIRIKGFAIGATACTLVVAVILGQFGTIVIPAVLKSILFGLFVFTIGYRCGPEFFASLSLRTMTQVVLALVMGITGLVIILLFARMLHLDAGTAAGLGAGSLTQTSMVGTATGALLQLGLSEAALNQLQANIAAGYAVTYISGYILVLLFVPLVAPRLMGIDLKEEAAKLEAALAGGARKMSDSLLYRRLQARAYQVSTAADRTVADVEAKIGRRVVVERILRGGEDVEVRPDARLQAGDEILIAGPTAAVVGAAPAIGREIEGETIMRDVPGETLEVLVTASEVHGRTLSDVVEYVGNDARGVFLRAWTRQGQEVPIAPGTQAYLGDVMTLVGLNKDLNRVLPKLGQAVRLSDRPDIAYLAAGLAVGMLVGLFSVQLGSIPLTLGVAGGALIAGLVCGWLRARRPTMGAFPPAAQQALSDFGLGAFIASIGLASGPAALAAIQANGLTLLLAGIAVTLAPLVVGTLFAHRILRMNPVVICGALAGAMTVDAAVTGACEVARSKTPVLGVAVPYAVANVVLTLLGPIIVGLTFVG